MYSKFNELTKQKLASSDKLKITRTIKRFLNDKASRFDLPPPIAA